jgi:hypothetical protein
MVQLVHFGPSVFSVVIPQVTRCHDPQPAAACASEPEPHVTHWLSKPFLVGSLFSLAVQFPTK